MSAEFTNPYAETLQAPSFGPSGLHPSLCGLPGSMKRSFDLTVSLLGLVALLPVMLAIVILIKLDSPGPALFKQRRVGLNGREFWMYKFRSMVADAEQKHQDLLAYNEVKDGVIFKMSNDPRITPIGRFLRKTSLDELPQLINVVRNEMSLIGPRPLPTYEVAQQNAYQMRRLEVLPGCTGLWQISGRSQIDTFKQMVELDLEYIRQWSFKYDLKILLQTVGTVLKAKGSY